LGIFREDALNARSTNWLGSVVIAGKPTNYIIVAVALGIAVCIGLTLAFASYTRRITVSGQLVPDKGLVKIFSPLPGRVAEIPIREGQTVTRGQRLLVMSMDRQGPADTGFQAEISRLATLKRESLLRELSKTGELHREENANLAMRARSLSAEREKVDSQIQLLLVRLDLASKSIERYRGLAEKNYVPREQLQAREEELIDLRTRMQALEREKLALTRDRELILSDIAGRGLKHQNEVAQIERSVAGMSQELADSESRREFTATAPIEGVVTAITTDVGQTAEAGRPLMAIVPAGSMLIAELYAPSSAAGFLKKADKVRVRYHSFPYQKFGQASGTVVSVSNSTVSLSELPSLQGMAAGQATSSQVFRVRVALATQVMQANGQSQPLKPGMTLEADIMLDKRTLAQWLLEPLQSISQKL